MARISLHLGNHNLTFKGIPLELEQHAVDISELSAQPQHDVATKEKTRSRRLRRNESPAFKANAAVSAIKGKKTLTRLNGCHSQASSTSEKPAVFGSFACIWKNPAFLLVVDDNEPKLFFVAKYRRI